MRPFTLPLLLLGLHGCSTSQPSTSIPFEPLSAPDTVRSEAELETLERSHLLVHSDQQRSRAEPDGDRSPGAKLVKRQGDFWLVYDLPVRCSPPQHDYGIDGFSEDGHYLRLTQRSGSLTRGQENLTVELIWVDLERASYATITIRQFDQQWDTDGTGTDTKGHTTLDSAVVTYAGSHVYISRGCTVEGRSVPCEDPGGAYRITPEALVLDSNISIEPVADGASQLPAPPGGWDRHTLHRNKRLCPGRTAENMDRPLVPEAARAQLLQHALVPYTGATLRYGAQLPFDSGLRITLLCERDDDHDLLWLTYDQLGQLQGVDTLASTYGDGQYAVSECIYLNPFGQLLVESVHNETLRDEVDTMAYRCDTLVYEPMIEGMAYADENGEIKHGYQLRRRAMDLTRCWVEKHHVNTRPPYAWHSLREVVPPGRRVFQQATGDLDRDGAKDHVLVLTNGTDDGPRDLLIAFTAQDRGSYVRHTLLKDFLPARNSGGFHDPIGEEGISGISIREDTLVITQLGGSAWKWIATDKYIYADKRRAFYLVETGGRSYHAAAEEGWEQELNDLMAVRQRQKLTPEQLDRYTELKEIQDKARWRSTRYAVGQRPMVR